MATIVGINNRGGIAKQGKNKRSSGFTPPPTADNKITNAMVNTGRLPVSQRKNVPRNTSVINSDTLKPQTPFEVSDTPPSTVVEGELARLESGTDQYTKNLESQAKNSSSTESKSFEDMVAGFLDAPTISGLESSSYANKGGVDDIQKELDSINSEILGEQEALRRKLESIDERGGGLQSGASAEKDNLRRESYRTQADLSIIQMGIQGRYDSAKTIADRYVNSQYDEGQKKIKTLELMYNRNKSLFDKDEQRAFDSAQTDRQNVIETQREEDTRKYNLIIEALKAGAPSSVIRQMQSGTSETAMGLAAPFLAPKPVAKTPTFGEVKNFGTADNPIWKERNLTTGAWEDVSGISTPTTGNPLGDAIAGAKIDNINNILNSSALDSVVGPSGLARTEPGLWGAAKRFFTGALTGGATGTGVGVLAGGIGAIPGAVIGALTTGVVNSLRGSKDELTGDRQAFVGSVEQMRAELTKEKLAQAKGQGVTFGALSDGERGLIANAATKIGTWAVHTDGDKDKAVLGYNIDEKSFKKEMDVINYFTKLDAVIKGATPESVGAVTNPDGTVWILNSDGTMSELKRY